MLYEVLSNVFLALLMQGVLLSLAALGLLVLAPRLQKRYGAVWLCRLWLVLAVALLVPLRLVVPELPAPVRVQAPAALTQPMQPTAPPQTGNPLPALPDPVPAQPEVPDIEDFRVEITLIEGDAAPEDPVVHAAPTLALPASPVQWLALAWAGVALALVVWQIAAWLVWRRRVRRQRTPLHPSWQNVLSGSRLRAWAAPGLRSPMVTGLLRPVLLVPEGPAPLGVECILAHERMHIRRHDIARKALLLLAAALHWYNPVVWLLNRRAARDIETACDAAVLRGQPAEYRDLYAESLLHVVRQGQNQPPLFSSGFALRKKDMKARLIALWDTAPKRRGAALLAAAAILTVALGGLVACTGTRDLSNEDLTPQPTPDALEPAPQPITHPTPDPATIPDPALGTWVVKPVLPYTDVQPLEFERYAPYEGKRPDYNTSAGLVVAGGLSWVMVQEENTVQIGLVKSDGTYLIRPQACAGVGVGYDGVIYFENAAAPYDGCVLDENFALKPILSSEMIGVTGTSVNMGLCWIEDERAFHVDGKEAYVYEEPVSGNAGPIAVPVFATFPKSDDQYWNGRRGYVLTDGKRPVSDVYYESAGAYSSGLFPVKQNGKWGYADLRGNLVIPCEYDSSPLDEIWLFYTYVNGYTYPATEGTVVLHKGEQYALFSAAGEEIIPFGEYERLRPVQNGCLWVCQNGFWGLLKLPEEYVVPDPSAPTFALAKPLSTEPSADGRISEADTLARVAAAWQVEYGENPLYERAFLENVEIIPPQEAAAMNLVLGNWMNPDISQTRTLADYYANSAAQLVLVDFYYTYTQEARYLGSQPSEGPQHRYYLVDADHAIECGNAGTQYDPGYFYGGWEAMALRQARALYAAGIVDFDGVASLTHDEIGRYLTARGKDFLQDGDWLSRSDTLSLKTMILCVDFTGNTVIRDARNLPAGAEKALTFTDGEASGYVAALNDETLTWEWDTNLVEGRHSLTGYRENGTPVVEYRVEWGQEGANWTADYHFLGGRSLL